MLHHPQLSYIFSVINPSPIGDSGDQWQGHCPAHDDAKKSLTVGIGRRGQIIFKCHTGCSQEAIREALGLTWAELGPPDGTRGPSKRHTPSSPAPKKKETPPPPNIQKRFAQCDADPAAPIGLRRYARHLGVPVESLIALGCRWHRICLVLKPNDPGELWYPERDGLGQDIGCGIRSWDHSKCFFKGSRRGLIFSPRVLDNPGPIYLVEGLTDTAALLALGLCVVGRPNNTSGINHLAVLLRSVPSSREIVVVGENDQKPSGAWPGRTGAIQTAQALSQALGRPVKTALIAQPYKDSRDWYRSAAADGPVSARQFHDSLAFFSPDSTRGANVTDDEIEEAAKRPFDPRRYYTYPEELCNNCRHYLQQHRTRGNLRHALFRCGRNDCVECLLRKKRLRYESLCRHFDALQAKGGRLHCATRTFTEQEWASLRRSILRHKCQFVRNRLPDNLFVVISSFAFAGSSPLPFDAAKEYLKNALDNSVAEGRGRPFATASKEWAMAREKTPSRFRNIGKINLPAQVVKDVCKYYEASYEQKRPTDSSLLLYGNIGKPKDKKKEAELIQSLLDKINVSQSHILYMNDPDKNPPGRGGIPGWPSGWDDWFWMWAHPTA